MKWSNLKPDYYYPDIFSIDLDQLSSRGVRGIISDIDNTIVAWSEEELLKEVFDWFADLKERDFKVCLVSNGTGRRVGYFSRELGIPAVGQAIKPAKRAFRQAREKLGLAPEEIAVIGDQIFTDILGGNRMGFQTILVDPLSPKEFLTTRFVRSLEKLVFKRRD